MAELNLQDEELMEEVLAMEKRYKMTSKEALFCYAFRGRGTAEEAAEIAGLSYSHAKRILMRDRVKKYLIEREGRKPDHLAKLMFANIVSKKNLLAKWAEMMKDPEVSEGGQLKAMDSIAKTMGLFVERKVLEGGDTPIRVDHRVKTVDITDRVGQILKDREASGKPTTSDDWLE